MGSYWSMMTPDSDNDLYNQRVWLMTDDEGHITGKPTTPMLDLCHFQKDKRGQGSRFPNWPKRKTPVKPLYLVGLQEVVCCADKESGYFHPTLGTTFLLPITPGVKYAKTPNGLNVIKPET
jgi:hypothetical protein